MANITISGASTGSFNMTDEIRDIGNSKYLKVAMSDKPYYARLSIEKPSDKNMYVIIDNTKYYVQTNPISFEPIQNSHGYTKFEIRFTVWLPKGKYLVEFKGTTDSFTIPSGLNATIIHKYDIGGPVVSVVSTDGRDIFRKVRRAARELTWFRISRRGD